MQHQGSERTVSLLSHEQRVNDTISDPAPQENIKSIPLTVCKVPLSRCCIIYRHFSRIVQNKPFAKHFKGDPLSFEETSDYLQEYFEGLDGTGKRIYTHFTCATDRNVVRPVFESMKGAHISYDCLFHSKLLTTRPTNTDALLDDYLAAAGI